MVAMKSGGAETASIWWARYHFVSELDTSGKVLLAGQRELVQEAERRT